MPSPNAAALKKQLFCKVRDERLAAVPRVAALPKEEALPLLRRGAGHWDRDLRRQCAKALVKLGGIGEADRLSALAKKGLLPMPFVVSSIAKTRTPEFVVAVIRRAQRSPSDRVANLLAHTFRKDPAAKPLWAEWELLRRAAFVEAERKRDVQRAKVAAKEAERARKEAEKRRQWCDYQGLKDATGARPELFRALFGIWTKDNACFSEMYEHHEIPKRHGGTREIHAPATPLKSIQRSILDNLLSRAPLHAACHGFREGCSTSSNAAPHVGHDVVVNLDLRDFFPTLTSGRVAGLFEQLDVPGGVLGRRFLVDAVTFQGKLPQGAPTSPVIANLIARRLDSRLAGLAARIGATYTRYADDLTLSGTTAVLSILPRVREIIEEEGFVVAEEKTRVLRKGVRQDVTGLTVNAQVSVPRALRRRLRAAVHAATTGKDPRWKGEKLSMASLRGHLAYLHGVHPAEAARLLGQLPAGT